MGEGFCKVDRKALTPDPSPVATGEGSHFSPSPAAAGDKRSAEGGLEPP